VIGGYCELFNSMKEKFKVDLVERYCINTDIWSKEGNLPIHDSFINDVILLD
jgi:hypothetical protein